jgi:tetratricopeptide (TPR) repeat protein
LAYLNLAVAQGNLKDYAAAENSIQKAIDWYRPGYFDGTFDSEVSDDITKATQRSVISSYGNEFDAALYYELANLQAFHGGKEFEARLDAADRHAEKTASLVEGYLTALNWAWYQLRKQPGDYGALAVQGHLWRKSGYDNWAKYYFLRFQCEHQKQSDPRYEALANWVVRQLKALPKNVPVVDCSTPPSSNRDPRTRVSEADALGSAGRYKEALALLDQGIQEDPTNIDLLLTRARYRKFQGNWEEKDEGREKYYDGSRQDFAAALKLVEQDEQKASYKPIVYSWWAAFGPLLTTMDDTQRRSYLEKALELGPANPYELSELSRLIEKDDPKRAIQLLERSVKFDPSAGSYHRLAKLLRESGRSREALESIKRAIALDSEELDYYEERERVEASLGISEVDRKRRLAASRMEIGDSQLRRKNIAEAYASYNASLKILNDLAAKDKNQDADLSLARGRIEVKGRIEHLWEVAKSSRTVQYTSGRVLTVSAGAGSVREVTVDRGADDGLEVGAEGSVLSAESKTGDHERKVLVIGKSRVTAVARDRPPSR